jgi:hypothetical protein
MPTVALCMGGCLYLRKDAEGSLRNLALDGLHHIYGLAERHIVFFALQLSTLFVVHTAAGVLALVAAWLVGPRYGFPQRVAPRTDRR